MMQITSMFVEFVYIPFYKHDGHPWKCILDTHTSTGEYRTYIRFGKTKIRAFTFARDEAYKAIELRNRRERLREHKK